MAYLSAVSSLDSVEQWEINDPSQTTGGAGGGANRQAQALLNRLKYYADGAYQSIIASVGTVLNNATYKPIIASVATVINAAKVWTTTGTGADDGNGGQPPAPKPTASAGIGLWTLINPGDNTAYAPSGTYAYFATLYVVQSGDNCFVNRSLTYCSVSGAISLSASGVGTAWKGIAFKLA